MTTTTEKTIEYLKTEQITLEWMTGEGTGGGVESAALPAPSLRRCTQRSEEMGIIERDRRVFVPTEAAAQDPPLWPGAPAQGLGEQYPKPHTPPPLGGDP